MGSTRMSSSFLLVPAASADSVAELRVTIQRMGKIPGGEPAAELAGMLDDLAGVCGDALRIDRRASAHGALVTLHRSEPGLLTALFAATRDRSIAAYDRGLSRLYNPRGSVATSVLLAGEVLIPYMNSQLLEDIVRMPVWPDPESPFFVVEREEGQSGDGDYYVQTYRNDDGSYDLEYRDGSFERHFGFETFDPLLVTDVIWAWITQDPHWRTAIPWARVKFDS